MSQNSNHDQYWQIPDQVDHESAAEETITATTSLHVQNQPPNPTTHVPHNNRSNNNNFEEVAELTWENGQPAVHGYSRGHDDLQTLESIVHQAKSLKHNINMHMNMNMIMMTRSSPPEEAGIWGVAPENVQTNDQLLTKKRMWPETWRDNDLSRSSSGRLQLHDDTVTERSSGCGSASASASATFCRENFTDAHTSSMRPSSLDSPTSLKTKTTHEHDSAFHGKDKEEDEETKGKTVRSHATRRSRVAGIHNESERRRRDRINQKMKALQKLVPNARKTDKASMLDEVIDYLRKLQAQVHLMSSRVNYPQMKNHHHPPPPPLALLMLQQQQQQLQMSLQLSGLGMGVINSNPAPMPPSSISVPQCLQSPIMASAAAAFVVPSPVAVPPCPLPFPAANCDASANSTAYHHPYAAYFTQQAENMDFYSKMATLYGQATATATATASQSDETTTASDQNPPKY